MRRNKRFLYSPMMTLHVRLSDTLAVALAYTINLKGSVVVTVATFTTPPASMSVWSICRKAEDNQCDAMGGDVLLSHNGRGC